MVPAVMIRCVAPATPGHESPASRASTSSKETEVKSNLFMTVAAMASLGLAGSVFAGNVIVPVILDQDTASVDEEGDPDNVVLEIDLGLGPNVIVNGLGWDMTLETFGASWASEGVVAIGDTSGNVGVYMTPGSGVDEPLVAPTNYSNLLVDLAAVAIDDFILPDGKLRLEFYEGFDDVADVADAQWLAGSTISVQVDACPEDITGDEQIDVDDLIAVILDWNTDGTINGGDVNIDGIVNVDDLIAIIINFGACP
jgi:hypothetical protein